MACLAEAWGGEGGRAAAGVKAGTAAHPPQELWRRVASFAFEALLAWPDTAAFGPAPRGVVAASGWWGGGWAAELRRRGSTRLLTDVRWRHIREQRLHERFPLLMSGKDPRVTVSGPADPEPTLAWHNHAWRVDERRTGNAASAFGPTTPPITLDPPCALSVDWWTSAFATERLGDRYYWLREDGGALLYVCGEHKVTRAGRSRRRSWNHCSRTAMPTFACACSSRMAAASKQPVSLTIVDWPRVVRASRFHEQEGVLPSSLFRPAADSKDRWAPQPRLWHRLADALEAWLDPARTGEASRRRRARTLCRRRIRLVR